MMLTISSAAEPAPPKADRPEAELLALYGMDSAQWDAFHDGRPIANDELEPLLQAMIAVRRFTLGEIRGWQHSGLPADADLSETRSARGRIYRFQGHVKRVTAEALSGNLAERFQLARYYRCQFQTADHRPVVVDALAVPRAWKLDAPLNEPAAVSGFLIKREGPAASAANPIFAAQRVESYPDDLLGRLGMDVGLLDDAEDRTPIRTEERACFYNLLAAAGHSQPDELLRIAGNYPSVVPLFNEPAQQRGHLVGLTGTAIRAIPIVVEDREMQAVYGVERYYEVEVVNADSRGNPLVFCVLELPPGMPTGERIEADVHAAGFYFKSWAYHPRAIASEHVPKEETRLRLAPLMIGRELALVRPAAGSSLVGGVSLGLLAAVALGLFALGWWFRREDREFRLGMLTVAESPNKPDA